MYNQYTLHVTKMYSQAIQVLKGTRHVKQCQECVGEDEKLYKIVKINKIYSITRHVIVSSIHFKEIPSFTQELF